MLRLAAPVLLEQILAVLVWLSDRVLTGHYLETSHLAAITLMAYLLWLVYGLFSVVAIGATALVARFVGGGQRRLARHAANQAFLVGGIATLAVVALAAVFGPRAILLLQLEGESAELAGIYLRYMLPAIPLMMVDAVGIACLRAAGDMVPGLVIMAIVNVVNISVSWALVLGLGPLPACGWHGIAIGTLTGFVVGGLLVLLLFLRGRAGLRLRLRLLRPHPDLIRRLLRIGLPGGADMLSVIGCQLWFVAIINQLGDVATAAHGVAISIESMAFLPGVAFQTAAATLAGQFLGAGDPRRASRVAWLAFLVGGGLMMGVGAVLFTQADLLASLFVKAQHADVSRAAAPLLRVIALAMPALALTMILNGALRGAGDTRWPLAFSLTGLLGVRIPTTYWLAFPAVVVMLTGTTLDGFGLGVLGAWYAMAADLHVRAALVLGRFLHGGWKHTKV